MEKSGTNTWSYGSNGTLNVGAIFYFIMVAATSTVIQNNICQYNE